MIYRHRVSILILTILAALTQPAHAGEQFIPMQLPLSSGHQNDVALTGGKKIVIPGAKGSFFVESPSLVVNRKRYVFARSTKESSDAICQLYEAGSSSTDANVKSKKGPAIKVTINNSRAAMGLVDNWNDVIVTIGCIESGASPVWLTAEEAAALAERKEEEAQKAAQQAGADLILQQAGVDLIGSREIKGERLESVRIDYYEVRLNERKKESLSPNMIMLSCRVMECSEVVKLIELRSDGWVIEFLNGELKGKFDTKWTRLDDPSQDDKESGLVEIAGCSENSNICVGDVVYVLSKESSKAVVVGIGSALVDSIPQDKFVIRYLDWKGAGYLTNSQQAVGFFDAKDLLLKRADTN